VTPDEARRMFVDIAVEETADVLAEDRHPDAERILVRVAERLERIDMTDALIHTFATTQTDDEAKAVWRAKVRGQIRRQIADMRPS